MAYKLDGTLYKIAYGWQKEEVLETYDCVLFWTTVFAVLIAWPLIFSTRAFGWVVRIIGAPFALLLFGYWPAGSDWRLNIDNDGGTLPFRPISWWPKFGGRQVMPIAVIIILAIIVFVAAGIGIVIYVYVIQSFFIDIVFASGTYTTVFLGVAASMISALILWKVPSASESEVWQMCKAYARSWKEKHCALVTFE